MRSKTLISYQKGYCGQPADIEAMKPREARAYCLGVGHVAAGTLPFGSGAKVLAALSTRRRDVGGGDEAMGQGGDAATAATATTQTEFPFTIEATGPDVTACMKALADIAFFVGEQHNPFFVRGPVQTLPRTFDGGTRYTRNCLVTRLREAGAIVTVPSSKDSPR